MDPTILEFKLKYPLLKLFEITISDHSSGVNTLHCDFMYKNLNSKSLLVAVIAQAASIPHMLRIGIRISSPPRFWYTSTTYDFMENLLIT